VDVPNPVLGAVAPNPVDGADDPKLKPVDAVGAGAPKGDGVVVPKPVGAGANKH
jgi:hypothetical protein